MSLGAAYWEPWRDRVGLTTKMHKRVDMQGLFASCSFTWVLHERGALRLWLSAGDVPDYALYTATWALIAPKLPELFPGDRMYPTPIYIYKTASWVTD